MTYQIDKIRRDFPALSLQVNGHPLVYLDSGASAQKPDIVIERMVECMQKGYANVHRGVHYLSEVATNDYEAARQAIATFMGAEHTHEIVLGMNATALINLVAHCYAAEFLTAKDTLLISAMEHHANIVPWQIVAKRAGFSMQMIPIREDGTLDIEVYRQLLQDHSVKLVALCHSSNVLGTINPIAEIIEDAHSAGAKVLIDGCQGIVHEKVNVKALDVDFYCGAGHKLYGPSGIGFLYGKQNLLAEMPPLMGGGDMIETVEYFASTYADAPARFEPGTPPIIEAIGLHSALDYMTDIGIDSIFAHEHKVTEYMLEALCSVPCLKIYGSAINRAGVVSFSLGQNHPQDVSQLLDQLGGVAVRAGHHCAMPLHKLLRVPHEVTLRASLGMYNSVEDVDTLYETLLKVRSMLGDE